MCATIKELLFLAFQLKFQILAYATRAQFYTAATRWQKIPTVAGTSGLSGTGMTQLCVKFDQT